MSSPITPVTPGTSGYGLAWKQVVVLSVDGNVAQVRDQLSQTFWMSRTNLRAKGTPPQVGESWIVDRSYLNDWTFALIVNQPVPPARPPVVYAVADATARDAIQSPEDGMVVFRIDRAYHEQYSATSNTWFALPRTGLIRRWDPLSNLSMPGGTETVDPDTVVTQTFDAARRYEVSYTTRFSQTNTSGTLSLNMRYVAGTGPVLPTSTQFLNFVVSGNGANNAGLSATKVMPPGLSGVYTVGVSFFAGSGGGNTTVYGGSSGEGRTLIFKDVGIPQQ
jgi:hypothetical protein